MSWEWSHIEERQLYQDVWCGRGGGRGRGNWLRVEMVSASNRRHLSSVWSWVNDWKYGHWEHVGKRELSRQCLNEMMAAVQGRSQHAVDWRRTVEGAGGGNSLLVGSDVEVTSDVNSQWRAAYCTACWTLTVSIWEPSLFGWMPSFLKNDLQFQNRLKFGISTTFWALQADLSQ